MSVDTSIIHKQVFYENKASRLPYAEKRNTKSQNDPHISDKGYLTYSFTNKGVVCIKSNEKKVAICELEWLVLREGSKDTEWKWFTLTLSICLSLMFSAVCLLGTIKFQNTDGILWLPLLAVVIHIAGCTVFGILSIYLWQRRQSTKRDPIYQLLKKRVDNEFAGHSCICS